MDGRLDRKTKKLEIYRYVVSNLVPHLESIRGAFGIRGEVDGCMPEVAWELISLKSFRNGLTLDVMPGVGHFPQLEDPRWISNRLLEWFEQHAG